jgi:hypothetical protein
MGGVFAMQPSPLIPLLLLAMVLLMVIKHSYLVSRFLFLEEEEEEGDDKYLKDSGELLLTFVIGVGGDLILWIYSMVPGMFVIIGILILAIHWLR